MNKKVVALSLLMMGGSLLSPMSFATPASVVYAQELEQTPQVDKSRDGVSGLNVRTDRAVESADSSYKLVNDSTGMVTDDNVAAITKELNAIQEHSPKAFEQGLQLYTFIYDNPTKRVEDAAQEVSNKNTLDVSTAPLIFVYNKADNRFHYVVDSRIVKYVPANYISSLAEQLFANGMTVQNLTEYLVRIDSSIAMAIENGLDTVSERPINETAQKKYVTVKDFAAKDDLVGKKVKKDKNGEQSKTIVEEDNTTTYAGAIAFALALGSIAFVFAKRKKRNKK